jgi:UDP-glucuronate 4-epimerase
LTAASGPLRVPLTCFLVTFTLAREELADEIAGEPADSCVVVPSVDLVELDLRSERNDVVRASAPLGVRPMRRAVVTGVAGFIGSHLAEALLNAGWCVIGVDHSAPRRSPVAEHNLASFVSHPRFRLVVGDVTGESSVPLDEATVVFHLAAATGVRSSWGTKFAEYAAYNVLATQRLMEACVHARVPRVVIASSSSVYGNCAVLGSREDDLAQPLSPYGVTKLATERLACAYALRHDSPTSVVALRYFTVYGPRQRDDMAIARMFRAVVTGEPMRLYGDGHQRRCFTYIDDAVTATLAAGCCTARAQVINVGGPESITLADVIREVQAVTKRTVPLVGRNRQPGDVDITSADLSRAREVLGYRPRVRLPDGLRRQWAWLTDLLPDPRSV